MEAAVVQSIDALYGLLRWDSFALEKEDKKPFANTPLHIAASTGQTHLALEIMNLKPSLARKLNLDGLSPLHLALLNGHFDTVKRLIQLDSELIRVKGRGMLTPLHYAAQTDDRVDILAEFLFACPQSITDQTIHNETALHIAVKNRQMRALTVLMGWIKKTANNESYRRWMMAIPDDEGGNTILHVAVLTLEHEIVKLLVSGYGYVNKRNLMGDTPLDIVERLAPSLERVTIEKILRNAGASRGSLLTNDCTLAEFLISKPSCLEVVVQDVLLMVKGISLELRNIVLVVAVLIVTATYQAMLSPPDGLGGGGGGGGLSSLLSANGTMSSTFSTNITHVNATILASTDKGSIVFISPLGIFYAVNTMAFIMSMGMVLYALPEKFYVLHIALVCLSVGYALTLQLPMWSIVVITVVLLGLLFGHLIIYHISTMTNILGNRYRMQQRLVKSGGVDQG
ncbi:hypothetical protein Vadar_010630 [Vaccinium darrowii]|uniref:Uncharacterized protein n=1 Tax=Vaccinium darrowii TaxID=229202 RepID=A0ACB7YU93_9ERIC|nr:hypothetical protein Vadar_010630 [Vaccinium darrowii]